MEPAGFNCSKIIEREGERYRYMASDKQIFLMKRPLQWSHLTSGLPIPRVFQELTYDILGKKLKAQDSAEVRVMFGGEVFSVKIYNINFNRGKFDHTEILQFKYDNNRPLLNKLQDVFSKEYRYCLEAHHIRPFTESLDNDTSNIMILSPNYHRIVHKANPHFNRKTLSFEFSNGLIEKVKLNRHL